MNTKRILIPALLLPLSAAMANFTVDFTTGEGYVNGPIGGAGTDANDTDWTYSNTRTIEVVNSTATTGSLQIASSDTGGFNSVYNIDLAGSNSISLSADFSFSVDGTNPFDRAGRTMFQMGLQDADGNFIWTQTRGIATEGNFNSQSQANFGNGNWNSFFNGHSASDIGLDFTASTTDPVTGDSNNDGVWTDTETDNLRLELTLTYDAVTGYERTITLTNLSEGVEIGSSSQTLAVGDAENDGGAFMSNIKNVYFDSGFYEAGISPSEVTIDSFTAIPEPSAFTLLAGVMTLGLVVVRRRR